MKAMILIMVSLLIVQVCGNKIKSGTTLKARTLKRKTVIGNDSNVVMQSGMTSKSYWQTGSPIEVGSGPRSDEFQATFVTPCSKTPVVQYSVVGVDGSNAANLRYLVSIKNVDVKGFTVHLETWADTKLFGIWIHWTAIC